MNSQSSIDDPLPPSVDLNTVPVLKALVDARASLSLLKGVATSLPNQNILIDTLTLQEALASSEIENIVTTQDEAYQAALFSDFGSPAAKEVVRYSRAMRRGYELWSEHKIISENILIEMFRVLMGHQGGYRAQAGTVLRNMQTGETVYEPPQSPREIIAHMRSLEEFINDAALCDLDPLVKMALIHHQFETIHPFPDGNGRIGRMLNVLYLTHVELLDAPILYLSRAINRTKPEYYRLLQAVRDNNEWEAWVIYMLKSTTAVAHSTNLLVSDINNLMKSMKHRMRAELPKIYSHELINNLFRNPYTRIEILQREIPYGRQTARKYLKLLTEHGFVDEIKQGRNNYYVNRELVNLLFRQTDEY